LKEKIHKEVIRKIKKEKKKDIRKLRKQYEDGKIDE
jgi:hypothetical protein